MSSSMYAAFEVLLISPQASFWASYFFFFVKFLNGCSVDMTFCQCRVNYLSKWLRKDTLILLSEWNPSWCMTINIKRVLFYCSKSMDRMLCCMRWFENYWNFYYTESIHPFHNYRIWPSMIILHFQRRRFRWLVCLWSWTPWFLALLPKVTGIFPIWLGWTPLESTGGVGKF